MEREEEEKEEEKGELMERGIGGTDDGMRCLFRKLKCSKIRLK